jgi:hypothetical protein
MDIIRPDPDGKPPWSPTVVNIMRARAKKRKRSQAFLLIAALAVCMFVCVITGAQINKPKAKAASIPTPAATATVRGVATIVVTPRAGWTPMPGNPLIGYRIEALKKP